MCRAAFHAFLVVAVLALAGCPSSEAPGSLTQEDGGLTPDVRVRADGSVPRADGTDPGEDSGGPGEDSDPGEDVPPIPLDLPQEFLEQDVEWMPCVLHDFDGSGDAECADITVPFRWDDPEAGTFTVHVKRLVHEGSDRQLFMLQGGPGSPGTATLTVAMEQVFDAEPGMDVYAIDHRGTGKSHEMTCPVQEAASSPGGAEIVGEEWEACALYLETDWGPLDAFTVSAAATDVALLVALVREAGKAPMIYGVSYGTFWAHRYAVLFPDQPAAVVLDSLIPPGGYQYDIKDQEEDDVTHAIFDLCAGDDLCTSKMGDDPWGFANEVFQDFSSGAACDKLLTKGIYPSTIQGLINSLGLWFWYGRAMIPAIFYRIDRCTSQDAVAVYNAVIALYADHDGIFFKTMSPALRRHLMLSELVYAPPGGGMTTDEILEYEAGLLSTRYLSYYNATHLAFWPVYENDEAWGEWAPQGVPILVLQGDLDYMTPLANVSEAAEHLTGPHQHFVVLPGVRHGAVFESPMDPELETHCGFEIAMAWLKDPTQAPDTSCTDQILALDFAGDPDFVEALMKTDDLWENEPLEVGCGLPEDFVTPFADDHAVVEVFGEIGDADGDISLANADYDLVIDGEVLPVDDGTVYVTDYFSYGNHYLFVQAAGDYDYYSSYHYRYTFMRITFPTIMLDNLKASGEYLLPFTGDLGYANLTVADIETKIFGEYGAPDYKTYFRMCPLAVADPDADASAFWVCHDDNASFGPGEPFKLAGNVALSTDPELLKEQFQMTGACSCWRDESIPFPCSDFDDL